MNFNRGKQNLFSQPGSWWAGLLALFLVTPLFGQPSAAARDSTVERITLEEGTVLVGYVVQEDAGTIQFVTLSGMTLEVEKRQIRKREQLSGKMIQGRFWRDDPNSTRLFFGPTARPLKAGQGYFSVIQIFFPFAAVGVTDFIAIGGGVSLIPGVSSQLVYLAPKITPVSTEEFSLSGGVLYLALPDNEEDAGIAYGVSSFGSSNSSLSFGLGWGFSGDDFADKPIIYMGGELRISPAMKLLSENWFIPDSDVDFTSFGVRFFGEHLAADIALVYPLGADTKGFPFFPLVGFAYNFTPPANK